MMVIVPEGTVLATGSFFVEILFLFVDNTCQALLADQMNSCGMAAGFDKRSTKKAQPKI